jgi:cobalamin biosynthetic protein CobC
MSSISRAKKARVGDISLQGALAPLVHGGDLASARRMFPDAPQPFIDLSTGINPLAYPIPPVAPDAFARLPEPAAIERLAAIAARAYAATSADQVVAAPGTQIMLTQIASLVPPGRAVLLGPTYAEHARAAAFAGHVVTEVGEPADLKDASLAIVVNPNNPDGRIVDKGALLALGGVLAQRGGLLMVDEAFMDAAPREASLCPHVAMGNIVVLRSFSKFFGLAGLRLGFAMAAPGLARQLRARLGPWAVSGPAIAIGEVALADAAWAQATRTRLAADAARLEDMLIHAGFDIVGGTPLFRLVQTAIARECFDRLGSAGILVRRFAEHPRWLRFGLPGEETAWQRLRGGLGLQ